MKTVMIKVPDDYKAISVTVISGEKGLLNIGSKCYDRDVLELATPVFNGIDAYLEPKRRK